MSSPSVSVLLTLGSFPETLQTYLLARARAQRRVLSDIDYLPGTRIPLADEVLALSGSPGSTIFKDSHVQRAKELEIIFRCLPQTRGSSRRAFWDGRGIALRSSAVPLHLPANVS